jgi:hypothetical protein
MGATCGRREREADPGKFPAVATVEGTPIRGMPHAFAGLRNNAGLGRSESRALGLVPMQAVAPATTGALRKNEEGNVVGVRRNITHALIVKTPNKRLRERGPVLHSVRRPVHVNRH